MKILLRKKLEDGRRVIVYNDFYEKNNIIVMVKSSTSIIPEVIKLTDEEEKWRDDLPTILNVSKEELNI